MLTSQNCGKFLSKKWVDERTKAMQDSDDTDQEWLELTDEQIGGVYNDDTYKIYNAPIDSETERIKYDIRDEKKYKKIY